MGNVGKGNMENLKNYITIKQACKILGISPNTLRRWDNSGKLKSYRNPANNYRLYKVSELKRFLKKIKKIGRR
jgi:site-specific DNA-methyltransferase (adenine-specific)